MRAVGVLRAVFVALLFGCAIAFANLLQLLSLVVWPFSRRQFLRINRGIARTGLETAARVAEPLHRLSVVTSGDALPRDENALVIANHQSSIDANCVFSLAWRHGRLGDLVWFVKAAIRHWPGVGWGLRFLDALFVVRRWETDRETIAKVFRRMREDPRPFWLLLFPEGTRGTPERLARARGAGLEALLPPHSRGFVATIEALRGQTHAVYDLTIGYPGPVPSMGTLLAGFVREVHLHVRRFPIEALPSGEAELEAWLLARWREKDERLVRFTRTGAMTEAP